MLIKTTESYNKKLRQNEVRSALVFLLLMTLVKYRAEELILFLHFLQHLLAIFVIFVIYNVSSR